MSEKYSVWVRRQYELDIETGQYVLEIGEDGVTLVESGFDWRSGLLPRVSDRETVLELSPEEIDFEEIKHTLGRDFGPENRSRRVDRRWLLGSRDRSSRASWEALVMIPVRGSHSYVVLTGTLPGEVEGVIDSLSRLDPETRTSP